jgi:FkbM family methyltransferase
LPILINIARAFLRSPIEKGRWRAERIVNRWAINNPDRVIAKVAGGFRMLLDTSDFLQRMLYTMGDFDPPVRKAIQRLLKPGDVFIDIGANVGFYALCASKIIGNYGKVFAFEPSPEAFAALCTNISLNGAENIVAVQIALSDSVGPAKLFVDTAHNSGATSMRVSPNASREITVMLDTYDHYALEHRLPAPALVKIDVEGAEGMVLKGMPNLLAQLKRPAVILEVSELSLKQLGSSKEEVFAIMEKNGYRANLLSTPRVSIYSKTNIHFQYDVLFEPA